MKSVYLAHHIKEKRSLAESIQSTALVRGHLQGSLFVNISSHKGRLQVCICTCNLLIFNEAFKIDKDNVLQFLYVKCVFMEKGA